jgi:hypothetical protein
MIIPHPACSSERRVPAVPERRRVVVIGAGAAGMTAALHIGTHSVLVEQRSQVGSFLVGTLEGDTHDRKSSFTLGTARTGVARGENRRADRQREGLSAWERQEIVDACTPAGPEGEDPVVVARWIPPLLGAADAASGEASSESLQSLVPLLRGELRLEKRVSRILPAARRVEFEDGTAIVYDKLVSSIPAADLVGILHPGVPGRIRSHQGLMYWLSARDVELLDSTTQFLLGDPNPFAAGRRVAETVQRALAQKFRPPSDVFVQGEKLFVPRLVSAARTTANVH